MSETSCSIHGCETVAVSRGWCQAHYRRWKKHGSPHVGGRVAHRRRTDVERFHDLYVTDDVSGCMIWVGSRNHAGYGNFRSSRLPARAHRWSYIEFVGAVPPGLHVLHRCDNPSCVNPAHLFLGTHADNMADMAAKGRARLSRGKPRPVAVSA